MSELAVRPRLGAVPEPPDLASIALPDFRQRAPWWGGDLQTLRNLLVGRTPQMSAVVGRRLTLPLTDGSGDALSAVLQRPVAPTARPLVVLIHGLGGDESSTYLVVSAAHLLSRGYPVLRLNLRGAGRSRPICRQQYHAGRSGDLHDALSVLLSGPEGTDFSRRGLLLVGYSLGGNMLLKFLAESGDAFPILGAASVSAPVDLSAASQRFLEPRNRVYHLHMLRVLARESLAPGSGVSELQRAAIRRARSIWEFDDTFVGPANGFTGAEDYYARSSACHFLPEIRRPTLVVHALDDPWIPADTYVRHPWLENRWLRPALAPGGGHVGFHARRSRVPWHDHCLAAFFEALEPVA